jgi:hypothetical protein
MQDIAGMKRLHGCWHCADLRQIAVSSKPYGLSFAWSGPKSLVKVVHETHSVEIIHRSQRPDICKDLNIGSAVPHRS